MKASIEDILAFLQQGRGRTNRFYPVVINNFVKEACPGMGTMGVCFNSKGAQVLKYDPALLEKLDFHQIKLILIHEVYHIVLRHIPRLMELLARTPEEDKRAVLAASNLAADYADNSFMVKTRECQRADLQEGLGDFSGVYPTDMGLPEFKSYEWYMGELLDQIKKGQCNPTPGGRGSKISIVIRPGGQSCEGGSGGEEGSEQSSGSEETKRELGSDQVIVVNSKEELLDALEKYHEENAPTSNHKENDKVLSEMTSDELAGKASKLDRKIKKVVQKASDVANKGRGTLPSHLQLIVEDLLKPPVIPWNRVLRSWITNTRKMRYKRSIKRPKRRTLGQAGACNFPGQLKDPQYHILYGVDTSGSMSNEELNMALSELQGVQKASAGIRITVVECDAAIGREYVAGPSTRIQKKLTGGGGTTFDPVFERAKEIKPDAIIYATDGGAPMVRQSNRVKVPVIWLLTPRGVVPGSGWGYRRTDDECEYGRILRVNTQ